MSRPHVAPTMRGFTLVELLVTMALLSLVMLGMASALRSMAQLEERIDARLEQADELRVATGFVAQVLGRVSSRKLSRPVQEKESAYLFVGQPDQVQWVGVMPARHGMGGLTFFRLALENVPAPHIYTASNTANSTGNNTANVVGNDMALVLRFAPFDGRAQFPDWTQAHSRVLVHHVQSWSLQYEDARRPQPTWVAHWASKDGLPERVRLDLHSAGTHWPLWIVPLRSLPASQGNKRRASMGPED